MPLTSNPKNTLDISTDTFTTSNANSSIIGNTQHILNQMPDLSHSHIRVLARLVVLGCAIIALNGLIWSCIWLFTLDSWPMALVSASFIVYAYVTYRVTLAGLYYRALTLMTLGVSFWISVVAIAASGPGIGFGGSVHGFFLTLAVCLFIVLEKSGSKIRFAVTGLMLLLFLAFHLPFYQFTPFITVPENIHNLANQLTWISVLLSSLLFAFFSKTRFFYDDKIEYSDNRLNDVFVATHKNKHQSYVQDQQKKRMLAKAVPNCTMLFLALPNLSEAIKKSHASHISEQLNTLLGKFDDAVYDMGLEKIDNVKETYMVAASLLESVSDHSVQLIELAKRFRDIAQTVPDIDIRIGIHTGAVTAGVVTHPRSVYSAWGECVDFAYKVQEWGQIGEITVSERTYKRVSELYQFKRMANLCSTSKKSIPIYQLVL